MLCLNSLLIKANGIYFGPGLSNAIFQKDKGPGICGRGRLAPPLAAGVIARRPQSGRRGNLLIGLLSDFDFSL